MRWLQSQKSASARHPSKVIYTYFGNGCNVQIINTHTHNNKKGLTEQTVTNDRTVRNRRSGEKELFCCFFSSVVFFFVVYRSVRAIFQLTSWIWMWRCWPIKFSASFLCDIIRWLPRLVEWRKIWRRAKKKQKYFETFFWWRFGGAIIFLD